MGRDLLLGSKQVGQGDELGLAQGHRPQLFLPERVLQPRGDGLGRQLQKPRRALDQPCAGQAGVAVVGVAAQRVLQRRPHPQAAVLGQLQLGGDAVGLHKAQLQRLAAEQIGVLGQRLDRRRAKMLEGRHRPLGRDAEPPQPGDGLPQAEHIVEGLLDRLGLLRRDAPQQAELFRLVRDHVQRGGAVNLHQLAGGGGPDVGQRPAREVGEGGAGVLRHAGLAGAGAELLAVGGMLDHAAVHGDRLAHMHLADPPGHRDQLIGGLEVKDAVAVLLVVVGQPGHRALQPLYRVLHPAAPPLFGPAQGPLRPLGPFAHIFFYCKDIRAEGQP